MFVRTVRWRRALTVSAMTSVWLAAALGASTEAATPASDATGIDVQFPATRVAIAGRLTAAHGGGPVANATVVALNRYGSRRSYATTNSHGKYRIADIANGDYRIEAGPGDRGDKTLAFGFFRASGDGFTVSYSHATVLHYTGTKLAGKDLALPTGLTVSGRITKATNGAGIPNVVVTAHTQIQHAEYMPEQAATTDSTGHYRITGLSRRPYTLRLDASATTENVQSGCYRASTTNNFTTDCGGSHAPTLSLTGSLTGLNVALPAGLSVTGSIVDRAGAGHPLCARVMVARPPGIFPMWYDDACGAFTVDHLPPGDYVVVVQPQAGVGFMPGYYTGANGSRWVPDSGDAETIHLTASRNVGRIRPQDGHSISGFVRDADGHPLQGITVRAFGELFYTVDVVTGADGSYRIAGLTSGSYKVLVQPDAVNFQTGWYTADAPGHVSLRESDATPLVMTTDHSGIDVRLPAGYTISGRITDGTGHGVPAALTIEGDVVSGGDVDSDANGAYEFVGLAPGNYIIRAQAGTIDIQHREGWYSATAPGHWVHLRRDATPVHVGP